ncbi:MAG TPA: signal peptidase II [Tepidisphaeraceae bacterium]|nr:signal peptidase II [Tepidisphaeraceae bacterium]
MRWSLFDNFRSPAALARFFVTTLVGLGLDLWTKAYAFEHLATTAGPKPTSRVYEFIPGWLHFMVTTNTGAVFGLGEGRWVLFVTVSVAAIIFLTYLFATSGRQRLYQFILGMLLAGVLGNMYDRIHFGYVRDMIHALPQWPNLFPWIFNVADVLLCTGVGLMVLYSLFQPHRESDAAEQDAHPAAEEH